MEQWLVSSTVQGLEIRATILQLEKFRIVIELYQPAVILRVSELLPECRIMHNGAVAYAGRALVTNVLGIGGVTAAELKLEEPGVETPPAEARPGNLTGALARYERAVDGWQTQTRIPSAFKMAVLDLHSYLCDLKSVCEEIEVGILAHPSEARLDLTLAAAADLAVPALAMLDGLRERFLESAESIAAPDVRAHQVFVSRLLHPLFLCAPFGYRTYQKPLGYAGDYEMMNMIHRNGFEGGSLYARLMHHWLVNQPPARSVRNRIAHMKQRLGGETLRARAQGRSARILNLGCGPAREVQDFIAENDFADHAEITLLDFDLETLQHATGALEKAKHRHHRRTVVQSRRMSVTQVIKDSAAAGRAPLGSGYDFVYCGGLFDYLSPRVCKQVVAMFYQALAPGGLLVVANMHDRFVLFSRMLEYLLDWHLIYRSAREMEAFVPDGLSPDHWRVTHEPVLANLFLEARKPPA